MRRLIVSLCLVMATIPVVAAAPSPAGAVTGFAAHGSVNQVYVTALAAGHTVELLDQSDATVDSGTADSQGAFLFRSVPAGTGYQVRSDATTIGGLTVTDPTDHPADSAYADEAANHPLVEGYQYLTTRDGTTLSINVHFPTDGSPGPWPVVVDYSGYDPSAPGGPPAEALVYQFQGYVVVGVNMRGTGCSGGAFEFMETLQSLDGYDTIETLAHQSWSNGHVGMVGISYSGYSQLYVAATNPPHLDAITPLSPYADTYSGILYPGGILNDGFAVSWAADREAGAKPAAHQWVKDRISGGDTVCEANQALRLQTKPLLDRIHATPYIDNTFSYLNAESFVDKIKVPTFLSSQWQDEQTGGSAANLVALFDPATKLYANFTNGVHVEPMAPAELFEAMNFIDLYVGKRIPHTNPAVQAAAPGVLAGLFGASDRVADFAFPVNNWGNAGTYANAKKLYEAQPRVRIRWENGTVAGKEGLPIPAAVTRHTSWPIAGLGNEKLYLQPDGALASAPSTVPDSAARASSSYTYDPTSKRRTSFDGSTDAAWAPHPDYHWDVLKTKNSLSFVSAPYAKQVAYAGQGSVDLWMRSSATDTDVEATLTEVRPDGREVYIQSGWLRASHRKEDPARSTELVPFQTHLAADAAPLPAGTFTKMRVELFPFAHVIRPGSRLRVNIEAPGGNQPFWAFDPLDGTATNDIGHSAGMRSRIVLPRVPAVQSPTVPAARPACVLAGVTTQAVSYRNQPCRIYAPARRATGVQAYAEHSGLVVTWRRPSTGPTPTSYVVTPSLGADAPGGSPTLAAKTVAGTATSVAWAVVETGVPYEFTVRPVYGATPGLVSDASLPASASPTGIELFGTWEAFVRQQLSDFRQATPPLDVILGVAALRGGMTGEQYIASLRTSADATANVDPVTRLYLAAFGSSPEPGGLHYWVGRRRAGTTISRMGDLFAATPAFVRTYGSMSNHEFVDAIYLSVLGRHADSLGGMYWETGLDQGRLTRGQMLARFSQSPEFVTRSRARVHVVNVVIGLLGRRPTVSESTDLVADLTSGSTVADIVGPLLASPEYRNRFA